MAFPNALMVEQSDSPMITEDEDYSKVTRRYKVSGRFTRTQLEQQEYIPAPGYVDPETGAEYKTWSYASEVAYPLLQVEFERRLEPKAEYDQHTYTFELPIEQHPEFVMKWRYELYASDNTTAVPGWAATASDDSDTVGSEIWRWSKTGAPSGFTNLRQAQQTDKVGVTSYLELVAAITKRKVYTKQNGTFLAWGDTTGQLLAPAVVIGLLSGRQNWLVRDVRIVEDQGSWAMTVEFLYRLGNGWDSDIYEDSAIAEDDL
jgi:hypothetical protein